MWLLVATIAQVILGSSAVFDKLLISRRSIDPYVYAFWVGILGGFVFILAPFGLQPLAWRFIALSLISGAFFIAGFLALYRTLASHEASELFPFIGAISPIVTLVFARVILASPLGWGELIGFSFLIIGGLFLFFSEKAGFKRELVAGSILASVFLALSYVLAKVVFQETNFITGFFWTKIGGVAAALGILFAPAARKRMVSARHPLAVSWTGVLYLGNRGYAAVGSALVSYAVFLANPALVDATQNIKYIVVFILAWVIAKERFSGAVLVAKAVAVACIGAGLLWLAGEEYIKRLPPLPADERVAWGVTFSDKFSRQLGMDWKENFHALMTELKPKRLRLAAYWDDIERARGVYDFSNLDWQLREASAAKPEIIIALGMKVPRWPECHVPLWAMELSIDEREQALRRYMRAVLERYRGNGDIHMWQIENEPYLIFGECPARGDRFLEHEIALAKAVDPARPVLTTDGGEFGLWYKAARVGDVFGTTMYRSVYPKFIGPIFGTIQYPLAPEYFYLKERSIRWFNREYQKPFIVIELQAEPWGHTEIQKLSYDEEMKLFSPDYFKETIEYAKKTRFSEFYLWGAEWWYQLKKDHNDSRIWEEAKKLFQSL